MDLTTANLFHESSEFSAQPYLNLEGGGQKAGYKTQKKAATPKGYDLANI